MRASKLVLATAAGLLVLSAAGTGYAAAKLPRNSVGTVQLKTGAVTGAKVKDGTLAARDLSAAARASLRQQPVVSGFGSSAVATEITSSRASVVTLASGPVVTTGPARLVLDGAVSLGNGASNGASSKIECRLEVDSGSGFSAVGADMLTESLGNSNHDQTASVALAAGLDVPAGSHAVRITCRDAFEVGTSIPIVRGAGLTATATPR